MLRLVASFCSLILQYHFYFQPASNLTRILVQDAGVCHDTLHHEGDTQSALNGAVHAPGSCDHPASGSYDTQVPAVCQNEPSAVSGGVGATSSTSDGSPGVETSLNDFAEQVRASYELEINWRRNLFIIPFGSAGADLVDELARIIQCFPDNSDLRCMAWWAVAVAGHLLLQKPHDSTMMGNNADHLRRHLRLWKSGLLKDLVAECVCIQRHLPVHSSAGRGSSASSSDDEKSDVMFSNLVFSGRIHSAIRYLAPGASSGGVLTMDDFVAGSSGATVRDVLLNKHPEPVSPPSDALIPGEPEVADPMMFQRITPELIRRTGRQMQGSSGPSGLDSDAWCRMLTGFKASSNRLCSALAVAARCLCTKNIDGDCLTGFTSARLIPLDKKPGVRPIAVGEVYRRLICRAIAVVVERDVLAVTAPLQTCVGVPSACESAVHAMSTLFSRPEVEGILLVDATNAFNALNRQAALHNVPRLCPALAKVFVNTYQTPSRLFITGGGEILSQEGTCQGDRQVLSSIIYS